MYTEALEGAIDENGEIKSDVLADLLSEIKEERETKILNIACWIIDLELDSEKFDKQIKRLEERQKTITNKIKSLRKYLESSLEPGEKFKDACAEITWRKSSSVEIVSDLDTFVGAYPNLCKVKYEPSKTAIKEAIESGELVIGAEIVEKKNLVIK
jgi:predicted  nucleic acid-binding Zn-ribbon protein